VSLMRQQQVSRLTTITTTPITTRITTTSIIQTP